MQLQKSSIVSLNAVTETKLVYCLLFFFGTHWYRARIVYFALSIPASVFPGLSQVSLAIFWYISQDYCLEIGTLHLV